MLLNATVAQEIGELTAKLRAALKGAKSVDDAVLSVVREAFRDTADVRFEGNNYAEEWVTEAERRGLPNLRRTPEALAQLVTPQSRAVLTGLGILNDAELDSRYHVRLERYVKDMLIELHTMQQMVDTMVLPAAYAYHGGLVQTAARAKEAGLTIVPQVEAANRVGAVIAELQARRDALAHVIERAEGMHEHAKECAQLLTSEGADAMAAVRERCDALELAISDELWPLPKYREMLFPV
jgi:glutamine synthetase